jgi:hypothetical protein
MERWLKLEIKKNEIRILNLLSSFGPDSYRDLIRIFNLAEPRVNGSAAHPTQTIHQSQTANI